MLRLELRLQTVMLHKGHDGFLRGRPEPVLLAAIYVLGAEVRFLAKARFGLSVTHPFPCTATLDTVLIKAKLGDGTRALGLVCAAFEEDSGDDIAEVAAELENVAAWSIRSADSSIAAPFALADLGLAHWA